MRPTILTCYPIQLDARGPTNFTRVELETEALHGPELHCAYLVAIGEAQTVFSNSIRAAQRAAFTTVR